MATPPPQKNTTTGPPLSPDGKMKTIYRIACPEFHGFCCLRAGGLAKPTAAKIAPVIPRRLIIIYERELPALFLVVGVYVMNRLCDGADNKRN